MLTSKPKVIFSVNSEKNGYLRVVDNNFGRELLTEEGAMLSVSENYSRLKEFYWGVFPKKLKKYRNNIKRALVFGLGGGVIQNQLFKMYPGIEIVTIEYDSSMNDIYSYFFSGDKFPQHKIINVDAKLFVKNSHKFGDFENYFDLIFVDTFSSFKVQEYENYNGFYSDTKKFLKTNGIFGVNMIVMTDPMFVEGLEYVTQLEKFYQNTEIALVGFFAGNSNLLTFSSDKLNL